ncbi:P-loop NTPase [bacterium]|nr:P-loop NTPase [bacterium]
MKLAISGKGGVGKSTVAATLALLLSGRQKRVLAVDADPDANLAAALGISEEKRRSIVPISRQTALIEERTGAKVKQYGQMFKLNPDVADVADLLAFRHENILLMVLGAVERGGSGCACPESVFIRSLITDLVLYKDDFLILDMEAGVEHLGRATARGVDTMLIVVEPGQRAIDCARRIIDMSREIGIPAIRIVANKVVDPDDQAFIERAFPDYPLLGTIPYQESIRLADKKNQTLLETADPDLRRIFNTMLDGLLQPVQ